MATLEIRHAVVHKYNLLPFSFPAVSRKQVTAACDGGRLTSDGGVMLLAMAERRLGIADRLARCFPGRRDPTRITPTLADMIRARIFAISPGYEDADDLDFAHRSRFQVRPPGGVAVGPRPIRVAENPRRRKSSSRKPFPQPSPVPQTLAQLIEISGTPKVSPGRWLRFALRGGPRLIWSCQSDHTKYNYGFIQKSLVHKECAWHGPRHR